MITENLSTLKIHKLTQAQYERERDAGKLDPTALYLTPDDGNGSALPGSVSWNDLKDKPFGEETIVLGDTITWDGTPTDWYFSVGDMLISHMSSNTPTKEDVLGGTFSLSDGTSYTITEDDIHSDEELGENIYFIGNSNIVVSLDDNYSLNGIVLPVKGIYFVNQENIYVTSFNIPGCTFTKELVKDIDIQYLPQGGVGYVEPSVEILPEVVISGNETDGSMYVVLPQVNIEAGQFYDVIIDDVLAQQMARIYTSQDSFVITYIGNLYLLDRSNPDTGEDFIVYNHSSVSIGTVILSRTKSYPETLTVSILRKDKINKIDTKYLPQGGFGYVEQVSTTHGDKITWDGQPTNTSLILDTPVGRAVLSMVSNETPTIEQIQTATLGIMNQFQYSDHIISGNSFVSIMDYGSYYQVRLEIISFYVVRTPGAIIDMNTRYTAPEKGIYFSSYYGGLLHIASLTIPGYGLFKPHITHKIDEKFLPDTVAHVEDISKAIFGAMEASY